MNPLRRLALWVFWNVPLPGWLVPHVLRFVFGSKGQRIPVLVLEVRTCTDRRTRGFAHLLPELRREGRCNSSHGGNCCICLGPLPDSHFHLGADCHSCPKYGRAAFGFGGNVCSETCINYFALWLEKEPPRGGICPGHWAGDEVFGSYGRHQRHSVEVRRVPIVL